MFYEFIHPDQPDYCMTAHNTDHRFPVHLHACFELVRCNEGVLTVTIDGTAYHLSAGEAALIFPYQLHDFSTAQHSEASFCIFSTRMVQSFFISIKGCVPVDNRFSAPSEPFEALCDLTRQNDTLCIKGLLYYLCGLFQRNAAYLSRHSDSARLLYHIFAFVENNAAGSCTLEDLSEHVAYDYTYLSRYFKRTVGIPFHEYVCKYRLSNACRLLAETDKTILECAMESGYSSLRSFNRNFKDHYGLTPHQYRRR